MQLNFQTLDVFTERTFGGNPVAVFPDSAHLPTDLMQQIAREMNLSETVFLGFPETQEGTARVRIFTPGVEVPFAGHPTIGAAVFLAGLVAQRKANRVTLVLEEKIGPVPVDVLFDDKHPTFAQFTTAVLPEYRPSPYSATELAAMVGLEKSDLCPKGLGLAMVSCGLPFHVVPVKTVGAVRRAILDTARWKELLSESWAHHVYLVCPEAEGKGVDVRVRMFAPGSGVPEDPATGSAAAALGGYLSAADGHKNGKLSWTVEQGLELARPSKLYVEVDRLGGEITAVRVGGHTIAVSQGTMTVPG
ncbi:MAG: PhzF family phenazine biosynthesis protein [Gemmatimonadota bacterium]|nr:PhzF family phenazine biosynthesis protein [Gemmatimonadota bacterium]